MDTPARLLTSLAEGVQEETPVIVIMENGFPSVPTSHDVVVGTWVLDSEASRHG
jgi:hypothetical protein